MNSPTIKFCYGCSTKMNNKVRDLAIKKTSLSKGWNFYLLPIDAPAETFDIFEPMVNLWRSKFTENEIKLPSWKSFSFSEFKGWHHHICLSQMDEKEQVPRWRIMSTGLVKIVHGDFTGETIDKAVSPATKEDIKEKIKAMIEGPLIGMTTGTVKTLANKNMQFTSLELPISTDGKKIDQFIHIISLD